MNLNPLPRANGVAAIDALHDDAAAWRDVLHFTAAEHSPEPVRLMAEG